MNNAKNDNIRNSIKATRARHADMVCKVYEVKAVKSKMPHAQKDEVNQYFREAKWLRNDIIADFDNAVYGAKSARVKVDDKFEVRDLAILGSQVRQDIYDSVKSEIKGLHTKKTKGERVGRLKFKSYCNCIPLRQFGVTYRVDFDNQFIKVQNIKKPFKVRGLQQIPKNAEFANAKMVRKPSGLYFHITVYLPKVESVITNNRIGLDFGIGHNITTSDGDVYDICIPESKGTKLASKRVNKSHHKNGKKKSNNRRKRVAKLRRAYERDANRKMDKAHKICHKILSENDFVAIQDEMIHNWHKGLFGKQVQHSAMGTIKAKLKTSSKTHVVERSYPSTQICPVCGKNTKHPLAKRDYDCSYCGYHHPSRDQKSASSILNYALTGA